MARRRQPEEEEEESGLEDHALGAGQRQAFVDADDVPIAFYIHPSVNKPNQRQNLTNDIHSNGGIVCDDDDYVDTVIVNDNNVDLNSVRLDYNCRPGHSQVAPVYVERMSFVQRCIQEGIVRHRPPLKQGMGGAAGRSRTPFTEEDDDNLSYYLSRVIPKKKYGGRLGNNVYKELWMLGTANPEVYAWTERHSWKSWRERYKKNASRLDILIKRYVRKYPPQEQGLYTLRRGWSSKHQRSVNPHISDEEGSSPESESEDVDTEDVIVHPETRPLHAKRRLPSSFRTSSALAKRQRTDGQEMHRSDSPDFQARSKGKEKAVPPSDDENHEAPQHNSLFTGHEDDHVDWRFESHNPPEHIGPHAEPSLPSSSFPAMPRTSQVTLVETNLLSSQSYPTFKDMSPLPRSSANIPRTPPANTTAEIEYEGEAPRIIENGHVRSPSVHASRQASKTYTSPPPVGERVDASPVISPVPVPRPPAAKKRTRRPKSGAPVVAQTDPPYRNTRSRSRSVEPAAIFPGSVASKRSDKRKQKDISKLEPLHEEDQRAESVIPKAIVPDHETMEEEMDVEAFLAATDISGVTGFSKMPEPDVEPSPSTSDARSKSQALDTDDEQVKRGFHQATKQPLAKFPTSKYDNMNAKDTLRSFNANLPSTSPFRQSSLRPLQLSLLAQQRRGTSVASSGRRIVGSTPQPRTPARTLRPRKKSTSSTESFPVAGTRASDTKKKYEQVEKRTPYKPPAGTRAAQHTLSQ